MKNTSIKATVQTPPTYLSPPLKVVIDKKGMKAKSIFVGVAIFVNHVNVRVI